MKFSKVALSTLSAATLGFLALGLASTPAVAGTANTTFQVTATVAANCTVSAGTMAFGSYTGALINSTTSTISVQCTNSTSYTVALDKGQGALATLTNRLMTGPQPATTATLAYKLCSDGSACTTNFATTGNITGTGAAQPITVYGNVPANQFVAPGSYTDTIAVLVTY